METTFAEFMTRRYAEAEEYACGVTREQDDIARDAWETATIAVLCALQKEGKVIRGYEENVVAWRDGFMPSLGAVLYRLPAELQAMLDTTSNALGQEPCAAVCARSPGPLGYTSGTTEQE